MVHHELEPGDVLSYSAGSTQTGPFGFRKLRGSANLLDSLLSPSGRPTSEPFRTGDRANRSGDGWVIHNPGRLHPEVRDMLESWNDADWRRRTGYVRRDDRKIWIQLRQGEAPRDSAELEYFDFARRFAASWLDKPNWR